MDVVTPDQMRDLLERMPEDASLDEGRAVTRAWLRDQFGESAVEDPVEYLAALLEHEQAKRSGRGPTVH